MASFSFAKYLGGLPSDRRSHQGNLYYNDKGMGIGTFGAHKAFVAWADVESIAFEDKDAHKSRAGKALLMGPFALLASNRKEQTTITVTLKDGTVAYYLIDKQSAINVRAKIEPVMRAARAAVA